MRHLTITHWAGVTLTTGTEHTFKSWAAFLAWLLPDPLPPFTSGPEGCPICKRRYRLTPCGPLCRAGIKAELTPAELVEPPYAGHPGWSPALYQERQRSGERLASVSMLAVEHDGGIITNAIQGQPLTLAQAAALLVPLGLQGVLIATKSHSPASPRWRLVLALSRPCTTAERAALMRYLESLGLSLKQAESRNAACYWYMPSTGAHPDAGQAIHLQGEPLNVDAIVAAWPAPAPAAPPSPPAPRTSPTSSNYGRVTLERAYAELCAVTSGRHEAIKTTSYRIGGYVGSGVIDRADAEATLHAAARVMWTGEPGEAQRDGYRTIASGLDKGALKPVTPPERPAYRAPSFAPSAAAFPHAASPTHTTAEPCMSVVEIEPVQANDTATKRARVRVVPADASPLAETIAGVKQLLLRATSGAPRKIVANATTIFARDPRWFDVLAYQALADRVVKLQAPGWHTDDAPAASDPGPWTDADTTRAQAWLSREYGVDLGAETVNAAVQATAERRVIDPLRDYFDARRGTWDGSPRLGRWLSVVFGSPETEYTAAVGSRFLISAVARALRPGCKVDHVLVTEGLQGIGKSTGLRTLCPAPELFFDDEIVIGDKDAAQVLRGKFIIELGELSALSRHDLAATKAYITRSVDCYRPSFGRVARDFPRRCVFTASTNEVEYLKDPTGNRRFWPVPVVGKVDIGALELHRDQLWAEALHLFEQGAPWWLESDELTGLAREEQAAREQVHPWTEHVAMFLAKALADAPQDARHEPDKCRCCRCVGLTTTTVLAGALGVAKDKQDRAGESTVGSILRTLGWAKGARRQEDGSRVRPYYPPDPV